jgi:hypothetical protein
MDLKKILTVPGKRGLYKLVSQGKTNIIVESLADHSRMPIFASHQASTLGDICIFTNNEDIPLKGVFKRIYQANYGEKVAENKIKDVSELKSYMDEILPEYDRDRVHVSDMKKLFSWYNILHEKNLLSFDDTTENNEIKTEEEKENIKLDSEN